MPCLRGLGARRPVPDPRPADPTGLGVPQVWAHLGTDLPRPVRLQSRPAAHHHLLMSICRKLQQSSRNPLHLKGNR